MQDALSFSSVDGEAAETHSLGCLSVLLSPPLAALVFGALLFLGLSRVPLAGQTAGMEAPRGQLATFFAPQVLRWEPQILRWAEAHGLDPNLVATVMQIESCGDPGAISRAGAMGLFQVMPYHFAAGEDSFAPETNAHRGLAYLAKALSSYEGEASMALAAYNGGILGVSRPQNEWAKETQNYMRWGNGIYADAAAGRASSPLLEEWLTRGGASLCAQAERRLARVP